MFVADHGNNRVQVLMPRLDFDSVVGVGQLDGPSGVCANADVVVASETRAHRVTVFTRGSGDVRHRFGTRGSGDGQLSAPRGLCFTCGHRHIAVADRGNSRVSVFTVGGEFVRHVGAGVLCEPQGVACSAFGELVVADTGNHRICVFGASDALCRTLRSNVFGGGDLTGVAVRDGVVFAMDRNQEAGGEWFGWYDHDLLFNYDDKKCIIYR